MRLKMFNEFKTEDQFNDYFTSEQFCIEYFMQRRWPNGVVCVKCGSKNVGAIKDDPTRFKCNETNCKKVFSYLVGTIFQNTKKPLRLWFKVIFRFTPSKYSNSHRIAKDFNIMQSTAWLMLQRIRYAIKENKDQFLFGQKPEQIELNESVPTIPMLSKHLSVNANGNMLYKFGEVEGDVIEIDEAVNLGENYYRHLEDKLVATHGLSPYGIKVIGLYSRKTKKILLLVIQDRTAATLESIILRYVKPGTTIVTDELKSYKRLRSLGYDHHSINHQDKQFANGNYHTQHMEHYWKDMKETIKILYKFVSEKFAQAYLNEISFKITMENKKVSPHAQFNNVLTGTFGGSVTRWQLVHGKAA